MGTPLKWKSQCLHLFAQYVAITSEKIIFGKNGLSYEIL